MRGRPVTADEEERWIWQFGFGKIAQFKDHMNEYLEAHTKGTARHLVDACGELNAIDAWRQVTERGDSLRPTHVNGLMRKALWPRDAVPANELEVAIAQWELDVQRWESASGERLAPSHRKLALEEMCPEKFRAHLRLVGLYKLPTYEAIRAEIAHWLAEEFRKAPRPRAAALG